MARPSHKLLSLFDPPPKEAKPEEGKKGPPKKRRHGHLPEGREPMTVSQLLGEVGLVVERRFERADVIGEVTGLSPLRTGHVRFALKDAGGRIGCFLYASDAARLRFSLEEGMEVVVSGRVSVYRPRAEVQLTVERVSPVGQGALALAFEQLKARLHQEGLFDPAKKRPLPFLPRRVGVVTSLDAAALCDVVKVLRGRMPGMPILVSPTRVQGEGAASKIAAALSRLDRSGLCDVILLVRGGGSLEDLWAFNEPAVAHAVAKAKTPVVSGVGHETDTTIADLVADVRAATPSHAAATCVPERAALERHLGVLERRLLQRVRARLDEGHLRLERVRSKLGEPRLLLFPARRRLDEAKGRLEREGRRRLGRARDHLASLERRLLSASPERRLEERRRALLTAAAKLHALSPLAVLERGYALVWRGDEARRLVRRAAELSPGDPIEVRFTDGVVRAQVDTALPFGDETPEDRSEG